MTEKLMWPFRRKKTLVLRTPTLRKAKRIIAYCQRKNWRAVVGCEENESEEIGAFIKKVRAQFKGTPQTPRNNPCPCESGQKFKKCCLKLIS